MVTRESIGISKGNHIFPSEEAKTVGTLGLCPPRESVHPTPARNVRRALSHRMRWDLSPAGVWSAFGKQGSLKSSLKNLQATF